MGVGRPRTGGGGGDLITIKPFSKWLSLVLPVCGHRGLGRVHGELLPHTAGPNPAGLGGSTGRAVERHNRLRLKRKGDVTREASRRGQGEHLASPLISRAPRRGEKSAPSSPPAADAAGRRTATPKCALYSSAEIQPSFSACSTKQAATSQRAVLVQFHPS